MEPIETKRPLLRLSNELLVLIFQQLHSICPIQVLHVRRVCKKFHNIATPVAYHTVQLTPRLIEPSAGLRFFPVYHHIHAYTRHVVILDSLDPDGIQRFSNITSRLSSIEMNCCRERMDIDVLWKLSTILAPYHIEGSGTRLYVNELPLQNRPFGWGERQADAYVRTIPRNILVSLNVMQCSTPLVTDLRPLKNLLVQCSRLKTLNYQGRGQGTQLVFDGPQERMPALTELSLTSYDWRHDSEEVIQHWDFSRLEKLSLIAMPVFYFLSSVPCKSLEGLVSLRAEDWSTHRPDRRKEATEMLSGLVENHIKALQILEITCHVKFFNLDTVRKHGQSLQTLKIRDHIGFDAEAPKCPTLSPSQLTILASDLSILRSLEIDFDITQGEARDFLDAISRFRRLEYLTLHMQTTISVLDHDPSAPDPDYAMVSELFEILKMAREIRDPSRPWKRISINIGAWSRVMVRRLSPAWRRLNDEGIFAEKCFVLERNNGQYTSREEETAEYRSASGTPSE